MAKEKAIFKINFVDGGVDDFILHGATDDGVTQVRMFVPQKLVLELAELLSFAGNPGHAAWHRQNPDLPRPCSWCPKREDPKGV